MGGVIQDNVISDFERSKLCYLTEMPEIINNYEKIKNFKQP